MKPITLRKPRDVPVCTFIGVSLIIIFVLFNAKVLNAIPCGDNIGQVFASNFCHIDTVHLLSNLFALYTLSSVEQEMGYKPFVWLLIFLVLLNTLMEYAFRVLFAYKECSIGFSGILFGFMFYEIFSKKKFDIEIFIATVITVMVPSLSDKSHKISTMGHVIGALSGIVGAVMWKKIYRTRVSPEFTRMCHEHHSNGI